MPRKIFASAVSAVVLGFAGMSSAANVTSVNPQSIVLALQNAGYKAVLDKTSDGDPLIKTASDGNPILVLMTDCDSHKSCTTSEFVGVWDCAGSEERCKQIAASLNDEESPVHFLRSDDGKTITTYSYLLYDNIGISEALFVKNLITFSHYNNLFPLAVAKK
jgi:hypothetical protein